MEVYTNTEETEGPSNTNTNDGADTVPPAEEDNNRLEVLKPQFIY